MVATKSMSGICDEIEKLVSGKRYGEALELFGVLEIAGCNGIRTSTLDSLVRACIGLNSVRGVKNLSEFVSRTGLELDLHMRKKFLYMHVRCGMMIDARKLFDELP